MNREIIFLKEQELSFVDAMQYLLDGKCYGITPVDCGIVYELNDNSMLHYKNHSKEFYELHSDSIMGKWNPVIYNHKQFKPSNK